MYLRSIALWAHGVATGKSRQIRFRTEAAEQQAFERAARLSGLTLSAWIRTVLREAAERRLSSAGEKAPWVK
jgi:uncharacterized protein (DUF1778 family)